MYNQMRLKTYKQRKCYFVYNLKEGKEENCRISNLYTILYSAESFKFINSITQGVIIFNVFSLYTYSNQ